MTAIQRSRIAMLATTLRNFAANPMCYDEVGGKYSSRATNPDCLNGSRQRAESTEVNPGIERQKDPYGTLQTVVQIYDLIFNPIDKMVPPVPQNQEIANYWADLLRSWANHPTRENLKAEDYALNMATALSNVYGLNNGPIWFHDESFSLMLGGDLYPNVNRTAYCLLRILAKVPRRVMRPCQIIRAIQLGRIPDDVDCHEDRAIPFVKCLLPLPPKEESAEKVFKRALHPDQLCQELRALIKPSMGKGRYFVPPGT